MTKAERKNLTVITACLETVIECLNKAISPVGSKERVCIVCEQIIAIRGIMGDILKGGAVRDKQSAITKRPDGVYQAKIIAGRDVSGQLVHEYLYGASRLEVKEKLLNAVFKGGVSNG